MLQRTRPTERYARGLAAAVVAATSLILASNACPARAVDDRPAHDVQTGADQDTTPRAPGHHTG
ncbi:hypothetical protein [Streptomyces sp. TRM68367]|uniref:hypothetical protein n=1 Tax=Streptomyces sp. TRM68367 TaxID=2758415 RepID=UPI00165AFCD6|nr:hypothetical protein [Streptomyces sp. TRM68367]MBC9728928.1 hypothetical protein [Streptomyces sp. TRM68367]